MDGSYCCTKNAEQYRAQSLHSDMGGGLLLYLAEYRVTLPTSSSLCQAYGVLSTLLSYLVHSFLYLPLLPLLYLVAEYMLFLFPVRCGEFVAH